MARRRDVRAVPARPEQRRQGLVGLLQGATPPAATRRRRQRRRRPPQSPQAKQAAKAGHGTPRQAPAKPRRRSRPAKPPSRARRRSRPRAGRVKPPPPSGTPHAAPTPPGQPRPPHRCPRSPSRPAQAEAVRRADLTVLRGAPARTVQNMDVSLTVPTATSVRSVPVKLLIDNRIVINNHLARARGGKVSFTHLIGYALVKALRAMPEMNNGFDVVDGKPNLITPGPHQPRPGDRPAQARRHPAAAGAVDQGRRDDGLRGASGRPTRRSSARPATTSSRSPTSRAPRSA